MCSLFINGFISLRKSERWTLLTDIKSRTISNTSIKKIICLLEWVLYDTHTHGSNFQVPNIFHSHSVIKLRLDNSCSNVIIDTFIISSI